MSDKKEKGNAIPTCGIIMPISLIENCPPEHWNDVLGIIKDVCISNNFTPNLVSDADDLGIIHNRIVENIYSSDIVICDVSCKNANVMFELGMRLAFDKPTIIIKDDVTGYSFDTSAIEHLEYPRDLRFTTINKFKESLGKKLVATYEKAKADPNFSTFLKNFGKYKIAHLEDREVTSDAYVINAIEELRRDLRVIKNVSLNDHGNYSIKTNNGNLNPSKISNIPYKQLIEDYVHDYMKNINPSAPFNSEEVIQEITNTVMKNKKITLLEKDKFMIESIIRDILFLN